MENKKIIRTPDEQKFLDDSKEYLKKLQNKPESTASSPLQAKTAEHPNLLRRK